MRSFRIFVSAVAFFLTLSSEGFARTACERDLTPSLIRIFRQEDTRTVSTRSGLYSFGAGHARFEGEDGRVFDTAEFDNPTSHAAIARRTIGPAAYARAMRSRDSHRALAQALHEHIRARRYVPSVRDLRMRVERIPLDKPLPPLLVRDILDWYTLRGRLMNDLGDWLQPKIAAGVLQQLPLSFPRFPPQVLNEMRPESFVYKGIRVELRGEPRTEFRLSVDSQGNPFENHSQIALELELIIPRSRLAGIESEFVVINPEASTVRHRGTIKVFSGAVQPVRSETYSFDP